MTKHIFIINGQGGVGKDTICSIVANHYCTRSISAIDKFKSIARQLGWNEEKDLKSRKFLSELKRLSSEYNDFPLQNLVSNIEQLITRYFDIIFIHMREPKEIDRLKEKLQWMNQVFGWEIHTLLIKRNEDETFGNEADDGVNNYEYDYVYINDKPLEELENDFMPWFNKIIGKE